MALLIVDMQKALLEKHPYNENVVIEHIGRLATLCREKDVDVIYVRHDGGTGSPLARDSTGWQICDALSPLEGEKIFDKCFNSAFRNTDLKDYLEKTGIETIIITGMQAEYCIDATIKVAFEHGYKLLLLEDTVTTYDNAFLSGKETCTFYAENIWKPCVATSMSLRELIISLEER